MARKKIVVLDAFRKLGNKFKLIKPKTKAKIVKITAGSALLATLVGGSIAGMQINNNQTVPQDDGYGIIQDSGYEFDEEGNVIVDNSTIEDETTVEETTEVETTVEETTTETTTENTTEITTETTTETTVTAPDGSYIDPDGNLWSSEQDYLDYINGQTPDTSSYYVAPDGSYWESEEQYQNYINNQDYYLNETSGQSSYEESSSSEVTWTETSVTNDTSYDDSYQAPDGSYWTSQEDYEDFINGPTFDLDGLYTAPDGSVWECEADYLSYIGGPTR